MNDRHRIRLGWYFAARMRATYATEVDEKLFWLAYANDQIKSIRRDLVPWHWRNDR